MPTHGAESTPTAVADRVGVIRKLRWNLSLKRADNDLVIDTTVQRHKSQLSALLPTVQLHCELTTSPLGSVKVLRAQRDHGEQDGAAVPRKVHLDAAIRVRSARAAVPLVRKRRHRARDDLVAASVCEESVAGARRTTRVSLAAGVQNSLRRTAADWIDGLLNVSIDETLRLCAIS